MQFQDYYKTLEVNKKATAAEIKKAYRRLSKKYHPDHNQDPKAEDRFKQINEAYQVVGDEEKRRRYDTLGAGYAHGQDFRHPRGGTPGWQGVQFDFEGGFGGRGQGPGGVSGGFSDFFEMLFGGQPGTSQGFPQAENPYDGRGRPRGRKGENRDAEVTISLDDAYHGGTRQVTLQFTKSRPDGGRATQTKSFDVKIPPGTTNGTKIRLKGQGGEGLGGGDAGDLLLKINIAPHPRFTVEGHDVQTVLRLAPWEAALGDKIDVPTVDGSVRLTIPAGTSSGKTLRLRNKGLPKKGGVRGDLLVNLEIVLPKELSDSERTLYEALREGTDFEPRVDAAP